MGKKNLIGIGLFCFATLCALPSAPQHVIGEFVVEDPYFWLEGESWRTDRWLEGQRRIFEQTIVQDGRREEFLDRLDQLTDVPEYRVPIEREGRLYYVGRGGIWCDDRQLVDMGAWPESWRLTKMIVEGNTLAYGISEYGSDFGERWFLVDLESGEQLSEEVEGIWHFRPILSSDGSRLYYWRVNGEVYDLYCHRRGTPQSQDRRLEGVNGDGDLHLIGAEESLLIEVGGWFIYDIETGAMRPLSIGMGSSFIGELGDRLLFLDRDGRRSVVSISQEGDVSTLIPESHFVIEEVVIAGGHLAVATQQMGVQGLVLYDLQGNLVREVELPGEGTVSRRHRESLITGTSSSKWLYFHYQDLATPPTVYRCNVESGMTEPVFGEMPMRDDIVIEHLLVEADDGVEIPVTIYHKKDLDLLEAHPTLLYGYGGFGMSMTPIWSPMELVWIEEGGVYAVAHIRGGGENGQEWHKAAVGADRQRAYDDFIQVGEHLKNSGLAGQLAIYGRSNGGLLTAVCGLQRPDLFDAVISSVGVHDLIRFPEFTSGVHWMSEFGDPSSLEDLPYLLRFSPYHNVVPGQYYPPMLITTGAHDDRVVPLHSFKFAAMLQERGEGQTLLRVDPTGAHRPSNLEGENGESADMLTFLFQSLQSDRFADRSH
jgi:prolyl oligopeptidase